MKKINIKNYQCSSNRIYKTRIYFFLVQINLNKYYYNKLISFILYSIMLKNLHNFRSYNFKIYI